MRDRLFRISGLKAGADLQPVSGDKLLETLFNLPQRLIDGDFCYVGLSFNDAEFNGEFAYWWYDTCSVASMLAVEYTTSKQIETFLKSELAKL